MATKQSINLASKVYREPIEFRFAKVTTASTESAAPYTSVASIYRGMWLGDSTARAAELTGAVLWTRTAVAINDWLVCNRTPFGRWDGLPAAASLAAGTTTHQTLVWNNTTKVWEAATMTQVTYLTNWRLDKTNHKFQIKTRTAYVLEAGTESAWGDLPNGDTDGGTLDPGVPA